MRHEREPIRRRDEPPQRFVDQLPQHALLELQRTAANRAVGAMLARDATTAEPADAKKEAAPAGPHVIVPDIGTIPVESFQLGLGKVETPPGRDTDEAPKKDKDKKDKDLPGGDITFTSLQGEHSSALFRWSLDGHAKDLVIVVPKGTSTMRITLKGALITSFNVSGEGGGGKPMDSWTVNCTAMRFEMVEQAP
jgi:hypothetical protein